MSRFGKNTFGVYQFGTDAAEAPAPGTVVSVPTGSINFQGFAPVVHADIPTGSLSFTGHPPQFIQPLILHPPTASLAFSGHAPAFRYGLTIDHNIAYGLKEEVSFTMNYALLGELEIDFIVDYDLSPLDQLEVEHSISYSLVFEVEHQILYALRAEVEIDHDISYSLLDTLEVDNQIVYDLAAVDTLEITHRSFYALLGSNVVFVDGQVRVII